MAIRTCTIRDLSSALSGQRSQDNSLAKNSALRLLIGSNTMRLTQGRNGG